MVGLLSVGNIRLSMYANISTNHICQWLLAYCYSQLAQSSLTTEGSVCIGMRDRISMLISDDCFFRMRLKTKALDAAVIATV